MISSHEIITRLELIPLTIEGGYFRETYRAPLMVSNASLPAGYRGSRNVSTCIYYLLTPETFSAIHRVKSDEIFHFYAGDPVEMLEIRPSGEAKLVTIHNDLSLQHEPQHIVPAGVWQGCRLTDGGLWALMGCTVAPGFNYADFELADRLQLLEAHPEFSELIKALTSS
jgi:predicted cupin superfamily sugar epimerase